MTNLSYKNIPFESYILRRVVNENLKTNLKHKEHNIVEQLCLSFKNKLRNSYHRIFTIDL